MNDTGGRKSPTRWCPPPDRLLLGVDEVHVWRAELDLDLSQMEELQQTLAPDEQVRAARLRFPKDRRHFVAARGILRNILARYLDQEPALLRFSYSPSGKPSVVSRCDAKEIHFNLSHSHGLALYAITRDRDIGIDVELIQPTVAGEPIAEQFFSRGEVTALRALPPSAQINAFFQYWTRKEAYLKAQGGGLTIPLNSFSVTLCQAAPTVGGAPSDEPRTMLGWSLRAVAPAPGYEAALAVDGDRFYIRYWDWQPA